MSGSIRSSTATPPDGRAAVASAWLAQDALQRHAHLGGRARDLDARGLQRRDLVLGRALASRDDGAGVAHALAGWCGLAGDERGDGLLHLRLDELGRALLRVAADLAHHEDRAGARIVLEERERVDEVHALDRIAADADGGRLTEAERGQLVHALVGERARARDQPDVAFLVDVA